MAYRERERCNEICKLQKQLFVTESQWRQCQENLEQLMAHHEEACAKIRLMQLLQCRTTSEESTQVIHAISIGKHPHLVLQTEEDCATEQRIEELTKEMGDLKIELQRRDGVDRQCETLKRHTESEANEKEQLQKDLQQQEWNYADLENRFRVLQQQSIAVEDENQQLKESLSCCQSNQSKIEEMINHIQRLEDAHVQNKEEVEQLRERLDRSPHYSPTPKVVDKLITCRLTACDLQRSSLANDMKEIVFLQQTVRQLRSDYEIALHGMQISIFPASHSIECATVMQQMRSDIHMRSTDRCTPGMEKEKLVADFRALQLEFKKTEEKIQQLKEKHESKPILQGDAGTQTDAAAIV